MKALSNIAIILSLIHSSLRRPHARNCSPNLRPPAITGGRREPYRASAPYNQMTFSRYQAVPDRYMRDCVARRSQQRFTPPVRSQALAKREGIVATQYVSWGFDSSNKDGSIARFRFPSRAYAGSSRYEICNAQRDGTITQFARPAMTLQNRVRIPNCCRPCVSRSTKWNHPCDYIWCIRWQSNHPRRGSFVAWRRPTPSMRQSCRLGANTIGLDELPSKMILPDGHTILRKIDALMTLYGDATSTLNCASG
jgi:hypothetical protein